MPSPRRRPLLHQPKPDDLSELTYSQQVALANRGVITWEEINRETHRRVLEMNGGVDPYAHLRVPPSDDAA